MSATSSTGSGIYWSPHVRLFPRLPVVYIYSRVDSRTSSLYLAGLTPTCRSSGIRVLDRMEVSGIDLLLTFSSAAELLISFCGDPFFVSSSLSSSFRYDLVSNSLGSFVSRLLLDFVSICKTSLYWTLVLGEETFSGPFSSWTCTGESWDGFGISSSLYICISFLGGLGTHVSIDTWPVSIRIVLCIGELTDNVVDPVFHNPSVFPRSLESGSLDSIELLSRVPVGSAGIMIR